MHHYAEKRRELVRDYIAPVCPHDKKLQDIFLSIPRHLFVDKQLRHLAYEDHPLPIGFGQTISQPSLVALMTELLKVKPADSVLEIGTGSGYQTAILASIANHVTTIERIRPLLNNAKKILKKLSFSNITFVYGDGYKGYKKNAPYDKIIVTASASSIPRSLSIQLKENGIIIIPLKKNLHQILYKGIKQNGKIHLSRIEKVSFVPLVHGKK